MQLLRRAVGRGALAVVSAMLLAPMAMAGPPKVLFSGPGTVQPGPQSCANFVADTGSVFAIENAGGFGPGDRVFVEGLVNQRSDLCFPVITPAIEDNTITGFVESAGTLGFGPQSCLLFQPDSSDAAFALQNTNGFGPGDRVYVTGPIELESQMCFPVIIPAIEDNTINGFFAGCGELGPGPQSCVNFNADSGETFALSGNDGSFGFFDRIYVAGIVRPESSICFPATVTELETVTVTACGDINGDGVVSAVDLLELLAAWGPCSGACGADLNGDGVVSLPDLLILLASWG